MKFCFRLLYDSQAESCIVSKSTDHSKLTELRRYKENKKFYIWIWSHFIKTNSVSFFQRVSQMMLLDMKKIIRMGHSKSLTFLTAPFGFFQMHNYQIHYELSKPIWPRQASSGPFGTTNCTQMAVVLRATAPLVILYL